MDRRAVVELPNGHVVPLAGPAAELVAVVACTDLSERTLRLLLCLASHEQRLRRFTTGRIEVDVARGKLHPYLRETLPRVDFAEESTDVA